MLGKHGTAYLFLNQSGNTPVDFQHFEIFDSPKILKFDQLEAGTLYFVEFHLKDSDEKTEIDGSSNVGTVYFQTLTRGEDGKDLVPENWLVASCNRVDEDQDEVLLQEIAESYKNPQFPIPMVHLGDQVYCDYVVQQRNTAGGNFGSFLEDYRECYRRTWGRPVMQRILRSGSNWMLPDDHEVINNISPEMLKQEYILAGIRAVLEFELQLQSDIHFIGGSFWKPFFQVKQFSHGVKLMMLDWRFQRVIRFDKKHQGLGEIQLKFIESHLANSDGDISLILFNNSPLLLIPQPLAHVAYWFEKDVVLTHPFVFNDTVTLLNKLLKVKSEVFVFGGDVHLFADSIITRKGSTKRIRQVTTSGLTSKSTAIASLHLYIYDLLAIRLWPQVYGQWRLHHDNVFLGRNLVKVSIGNFGNVQIEPILRMPPDIKFQVLSFVFDHAVLVACVTLVIGMVGVIGILFVILERLYSIKAFLFQKSNSSKKTKKQKRE